MLGNLAVGQLEVIVSEAGERLAVLIPLRLADFRALDAREGRLRHERAACRDLGRHADVDFYVLDAGVDVLDLVIARKRYIAACRADFHAVGMACAADSRAVARYEQRACRAVYRKAGVLRAALDGRRADRTAEVDGVAAAGDGKRVRRHAGEVDYAVACGDLDVRRLAGEGDCATVARDNERVDAHRVAEGDIRAVRRVSREDRHTRLAVRRQGHVVAALEHDAVRGGNVREVYGMYRGRENQVAGEVGCRKGGITRNDAAAGRAGVLRGDIARDTCDHGDKFRTGQLFIRCEGSRGVALNNAGRNESRRRLLLRGGHGAGVGEHAQLVRAGLCAVIDEGSHDIDEGFRTGRGVREIAAVGSVDEVQVNCLAKLRNVPLVLLRGGEGRRAVLLARAERTVENSQRLGAAYRVVRQHFAVRALEQTEGNPLFEGGFRPVTLHIRKFGRVRGIRRVRVGRGSRTRRLGRGAAVVIVAVNRLVVCRRSARNGERDRKCARVQQKRVVFRDLLSKIVLDIDAAAVDFARNRREGDGLAVHLDVQLAVAVARGDVGGSLAEALSALGRERQHDAAGAVLAALAARYLL